MGKKGGGKAVSRNMENFNNHRAWLKDTGRLRCLMDAVGCYAYTDVNMISASNYDDYLSHRINYHLAQSLAMCSFPLKPEFMDDYKMYIAGSYIKSGIFSKVVPLASSYSYKPSIYGYVYSGVYDTFNAFYPTMSVDAFELYVKTLCILFEYEPELMADKLFNIKENASWFKDIYHRSVLICMCIGVIERSIPKVRDGSIALDGFMTRYKKVSAEEEAEKIKLYSGRLLAPAFVGPSPMCLCSSHFTNFKNDTLKTFLVHQFSVIESAFDVAKKVDLVDTESNTIKMVPNSSGDGGHHIYSYEYLRELGKTGKFSDLGDAVVPFVEIARMDLKGAEKRDLCVLKDKSYYDNLMTLLDLIGGLDRTLYFEYEMDMQVIQRVNMLSHYHEDIVSDKCNDMDKEIRSLTSALKSEKRDNEKLSKKLSVAEQTIADYDSRESVVLKDGEVVVKSSEIDSLKSKIVDLEGKLSDAKNSLSKASGKCDWQEKQIKMLEDSVASYSEMDKEILELRGENVYLSSILEKIESLNDEDVDLKRERFEEHLSAIKDIPFLFVGGSGNMFSRIKDYFPNSDYVDVSDSVSFSIPTSTQYVVLYTRSLTHSHRYHVENKFPRERIIFIGMSNIELIVEELYKRIIEGGYSAE